MVNPLHGSFVFSQRQQRKPQFPLRVKVSLLALCPTQAAQLLPLLTPEICRAFGCARVETLPQARQFIKRQGDSSTQRFAIHPGDVGLISTISYTLSEEAPSCATLSYWLAEKWQRQGYASEALALLLKR